jgi:RimJ/RimL family protein N-acetyltransferase
VGKWRNLLNDRMRNTDNAATLEMRDEKRILESGGAYFIHDGGKPLGLGWLEGEELLTVASLEAGAGEEVMHSLMSLVEGATVTLQVASTNIRAIRLYERLGFLKTRECSRWYRVK